MQEIGAYEAKTHLPRLLDAVERGETIIITRRGKPVARMVSIDDASAKLERNRKALEALKEIRKNMPQMDIQEILALRDEGRR